jgi:hypothetical protein
MAIEKHWPAVAPVAFTAPGSVRGRVTITSTRGFKVKQTIVLVHPTLGRLQLQVKRVTRTYLELGPEGKIQDRTDLSLYDTSTIIYADEQTKHSPTDKEVGLAVYEQEPTIANRVIQVDEFGDFYTPSNPLPVQLSDGNINIENLHANVQVQLSAKDNDPVAGDIHDSIRIGDGHNEVGVNADGSINVNIVESTSVSTPGLQIFHQESAAIPSGVETTLISLVAPPESLRVSKVQVSGENLAQYRVKLDGNSVGTKRTWWGNFNAEFSFEDFRRGIMVPPGSILTVTVIHDRPAAGNFEVTVLVE